MQKFSTGILSNTFRTITVVVVTLIAAAGSLYQAERSEMREVVAQPAALGKIAFHRTNYFTTGLVASPILSVNSDGTGETTIAAASIPPVLNTDPAWSPDGTKLVYSSDSDIWVMNADGSGKVNITNNNSSVIEQNPSWSLGGKIAYERDGQIWTMGSDGAGQSPFTAISQSFPAAPAWSPDGTKLAFTTVEDIWVINADGSNEHRVTANSVPDTDPAWSPRGDKIIFGKAGSGISVINLDGTNEISLTNNGQDRKPSWSSDGTKIAFVRRGTTNNGIFVMDAVGGNQLRIVADIPNQPGRNENDSPAFQPLPDRPNTVILSGRITRNGESLAGVFVNLTGSSTGTMATNSFGEYRFELPESGNYTVTPAFANHIFTPRRRIFVNPVGNQIADFAAGQTCPTLNCRVNGKVVFVRGSDIYISSSDGTNTTILTSGGINEDPAFSPDGTQVAFRSNRSGDYEIYRINVDGSNIQRLTTAAGTDEYPAYSPDGTRIAFVSSRDGTQEIYTINAADGSNSLRLTNNNVQDREPAFSPDGAKIVFSRSPNSDNQGPFALFIMNAADGSNALQITSPTGTFNDFTPSFSPDGTKLLYWHYDSGPFTSEFFIANANGTNPVTTGISGRVYKPSFSPDGTKVIYSRLVTPFQYDVEAVVIAGGGQLLVQNGNHADWQPAKPAIRPGPFDFDGDGKADIAVFRPSEGMWYILRSSDSGLMQRPFALSGDVPVPSDFDGDLKTDIAIYRPSNNDFWSLSTVNGQQINYRHGQTGDIPMPSDIDGDGRSDYVVYRPSNGHWYRVSSASGIMSDIWFGASGDKPVIGDFNGDGMADPAIYRPSDGNWWWYSSADGGQRATRWGIGEDIPAPADFDGDGKTDFAVFRPSTGVWYVLNSSTGGSSILPFGTSGDKPVPADYDGDGKADIAVFRPSDGIWYLLRSSAGYTGFRWGTAADVPVPNALIH